MSRRIGAGPPACEGRADRCKRQRATKLVVVHLRKRSWTTDASDSAQGEQQRRLKAVTGSYGVHDIYGGRLDFDRARFSMPSLSPPNSARDDDQACSRLNE